MLTTAKLDAASHCWVTSLANYNFRLHYRAGKANIDADALLRISWPGCMPDSSGTHLKVTAAAVQAVQEAALQGPVSHIEAYSSDLQIVDVLQDSKQIASMTLEDWHQAQEADPVLSLVITRLRDGMLGKGQCKATDPPEASQFGHEWNHLILKKGSSIDRPDQGNKRRPSSSWFYQLHTGRLLLEDPMMRLVIWAWSACWISCITGFLASHGCTSKQACQEVSPVSCFQGQAAKRPPQKYHGHTSFGAGLPWLPVSGTWEGPGGECSSVYRSFHQVCPGICHQDPDHPNDCQNPMGQVHYPLWITHKDPHGSRMKLWKSLGGWPLWADGDTENVN